MTEASPKSYYPLMDVIRLAAAVGVVWIHVAGDERLAWSKELGRFAVPFFACCSIYFALGTLSRRPNLSLSEYITIRFKRIYLLFLAWSVIYLLVRSFSSLVVEHTGFLRISLVNFFWNGVAIQLWFLPFILLATIGAFLVAKLIQHAPALRIFCMLIFAVAAVGLAFMPTPAVLWEGGYTVELGYGILPCCCAVMAFGLGENGLGRKARSYSPVDLSMLLVGVALITLWLGTASTHERSLALENMAGFGLLLVSLSWRVPAKIAWTARLGASAFGIYLVHPLFVEGMQHLLPKIGFREHTPVLEISIYLGSLIASFISVEILRRYRYTKWLTG